MDRVLELIQARFPDCEIGEMSTVVRGSRKEILAIIDEVIAKMNKGKSSFSLQITISNTCGCGET